MARAVGCTSLSLSSRTWTKNVVTYALHVFFRGSDEIRRAAARDEISDISRFGREPANEEAEEEGEYIYTQRGRRVTSAEQCLPLREREGGDRTHSACGYIPLARHIRPLLIWKWAPLELMK